MSWILFWQPDCTKHKIIAFWSKPQQATSSYNGLHSARAGHPRTAASLSQPCTAAFGAHKMVASGAADLITAQCSCL